MVVKFMILVPTTKMKIATKPRIDPNKDCRVGRYALSKFNHETLPVKMGWYGVVENVDEASAFLHPKSVLM